MKFALPLTLLLLGTTAAPAISGEWSYEGDAGPDRWGHVHADFAECEAGIMQSPVDLGVANAIGDIMVETDWQPAPLTILNSGYTVQANFPEGSTMTSGGERFNLVQVHFHTPSEHVLDGESYPLTAHFVHATEEGQLAVLGVMYEEGPANDELQKIVDAAPAEERDAMPVDGVTLDPRGLLPGEMDIYRYMGSLTTPPCSEGVNWHVIKQPATASAEQIEALEAIMGMNARPTQLLNGRLLVAPE